jgi:DNA-binding GntR family transcriptional regulator
MDKKPSKNSGASAHLEHRIRDKDVADAVQEIVKRLEEDVILGILHPRERLIEDELMVRFAAKRHVVRQALTELERVGLVIRKRNSGAQVRALAAKEVIELYAVREVLEIACLRMIRFPVSSAGLAKLAAIQSEHAAAVDAGNSRAVFKANLSFHAALYALSGNDALTEAIIEYARRTYPVRLATLVSQASLECSRKDHNAIIKALRNEDIEALCELCSRHLRPARDTYLKNLERYGLLEKSAA